MKKRLTLFYRIFNILDMEKWISLIFYFTYLNLNFIKFFFGIIYQIF